VTINDGLIIDMDQSYHIYSSTSDAWQAMYQAIEQAQHSIYWEIYIFRDDEIGEKFFSLLTQKSRAGVDVKLIIDAMGSFFLREERLNKLKQAGIDVRMFRERTHRYASWWRWMYVRTHRKILVIDEKVGFIGGVNVDKRMEDWRDIHLSVRGPIVFDLLHSFAKSYVVSGGARKQVRKLFRRATKKKRLKLLSHNKIDDVGMEFVSDTPDKRISHVRRHYADLIQKAKHRIILFSPYYYPDKQLLRALWQARRRGVKIDLLLPLRTDVRLATYAAYAGFSLLNRYGVNIHFLRDMMHGKGIIVDDDRAVVGSSNLDQTSFYDNYEANLSIRNRELVQSLTKTLEGWISEAEKYEQETWNRRSWVDKLKEKIAHLLLRLWHRH
jgi:cardiolipin synthase